MSLGAGALKVSVWWGGGGGGGGGGKCNNQRERIHGNGNPGSRNHP